MPVRSLGQEDLAGGVAEAKGERGIDDGSTHFAPNTIGTEISHLRSSHDFFRAFFVLLARGVRKKVPTHPQAMGNGRIDHYDSPLTAFMEICRLANASHTDNSIGGEV